MTKTLLPPRETPSCEERRPPENPSAMTGPNDNLSGPICLMAFSAVENKSSCQTGQNQEQLRFVQYLHTGIAVHAVSCTKSLFDVLENTERRCACDEVHVRHRSVQRFCFYYKVAHCTSVLCCRTFSWTCSRLEFEPCYPLLTSLSLIH